MNLEFASTFYKVYHHLGEVLGLEPLTWDYEQRKYVPRNSSTMKILLFVYLGLFQLLLIDALPERDRSSSVLSTQKVVFYLEIIFLELLMLGFLVGVCFTRSVQLKFFEALEEVDAFLGRPELPQGISRLLVQFGLICMMLWEVFCVLMTTYLYMEGSIRKTSVLKFAPGILVIYHTPSFCSMMFGIRCRFVKLTALLETCSRKCARRKCEGSVSIDDMCAKHALRCIMKRYFQLMKVCELWIQTSQFMLLNCIIMCFLEGTQQVIFWCDVFFFRQVGSTPFLHMFLNAFLYIGMLFGSSWCCLVVDQTRLEIRNIPRAMHRFYAKSLSKKSIKLDILCFSHQILQTSDSLLLYSFFPLTPKMYLAVIHGHILFGMIAVNLHVFV